MPNRKYIVRLSCDERKLSVLTRRENISFTHWSGWCSTYWTTSLSTSIKGVPRSPASFLKMETCFSRSTTSLRPVPICCSGVSPALSLLLWLHDSSQGR